MTDFTALLAPFAARCYVDSETPVYQNPEKTCHLFHWVEGDLHFWAFAGTLPKIDEWLVDLDAVDQPVHDHPALGPVHLGLWINTNGALGTIISTMSALGWPPFVIAGHSKGAGQAILAHAALKDLGHPPVATRAFEPPRVGSQVLRDYLAADDIVWTQTYNSAGNDPVTILPFWRPFVSLGKVLSLPVPDDADVATKHKIPAVLAALGLAPVLGD